MGILFNITQGHLQAQGGVAIWSPEAHSFESISMNFGYFVQYTSPLNRSYWYFVISPSDQLQAEGVAKWRSEALASIVLKLLT